MHCVAESAGDTPFWASDLANDSKSVQFRSSDSEFNEYGLYELPAVGSPATLRLLINNTALNNQTVVYCNKDHRDLSTRLFVFGKRLTFILCCTNTLLKYFSASIYACCMYYD